MSGLLNAVLAASEHANPLALFSSGFDLGTPTLNYHIEIRTGTKHPTSLVQLPLVTLYDAAGNPEYVSDFPNSAAEAQQGQVFWSEFGSDGLPQLGKVEVKPDGEDVCVAWLSVQDKNAGEKAVVLGEDMKQCGAAWYPSNVWLAIDGDGGRPVDCAWISAGRDHCQDESQLGKWHGFTIRDFTSWASSGSSAEHEACSQLVPPMTKQCHTQPGNDMTSPAIFYTLTKTSRALARRVCNDPTSYGPSLLSTSEGLLCDMRTRTLRPLCSNGVVPGCYPDKVGDVVDHEDDFSPSTINLDIDHHGQSSRLLRRAEVDTPGARVNYAESHQCSNCCVGAPSDLDGQPNANVTHYWGYGVDQPTLYQNVSGGIYISQGAGNSIYVAGCRSTIETNKYIYRDAAGQKAVASVLGAVLAAGVAALMML